MKTQTLKSNSLLFVSAMIWGFAFVAQRAGMEHVGPFMFNAARFALGGISLIPLLLFNRNRAPSEKTPPPAAGRAIISGGILAGLALFMGISFQQLGIVHTTAGKAGFITGLYVVVVPILGLIWKQSPGSGTWFGAVCAVVGLYFLSFTESFTMSFGDLLVLIGMFFWALHVHVIDYYTTRIDSIQLAFMQFVLCAMLSFIISLFVEVTTFQGVIDAAIPILYAGVLSVGVAFTLQVVAQREAHPAHAAIILSLEAVFAVLGGWLILGETLALRGFVGCAFMLVGMLLSQLNFRAARSS